MAQKRPGEEMQAVDVYGMGQKWRFSSGMTVMEALNNISDDTEMRAEVLVLERVSGEGNVTLARDARLAPGHRYTTRLRRQAMAGRYFGAGMAVDPHAYYYVPPDVDALVSDLTDGKYCALCGPRQSGKSTMVMAAKRRMLSESQATVVYLKGIKGAKESWGSGELWYYVCQSMHIECPSLFPARNKREACSALDFKTLFLKSRLPVRVSLVLDEADSLLHLAPSCISEFFATVRAVKNDSSSYNLFGFLLVGVETVRDLLEARYECRVTQSRLSPFPHDHVLSSTSFSTQDVESLLEQAAADRPRVGIDVRRIAESIVGWTAGHKGLTAICLAYLVQEELWKFKDWIRRAQWLATYVFGQATYSRIMGFVREQAAITGVHQVLLKYLEAEGDYVSHAEVVKLRDFIARGVLVASEVEGSSSYYVQISTPLLRMALIRGCVITCERVEPPPASASVVDREWLILQAIKTLDAEVMCSRKAGGSPSEYARQFQFICRLKAILKQAYPSVVEAMLLPQVTEVIVPGLKHSLMRLDGLVDGANFAAQLIADGTRAEISEHIKGSLLYHCQHSAQVFVINCCMNKADEHIVVPRGESIYFVSVNFRPNVQSATVTMVDRIGIRDVVHLPLAIWSGRFSFDGL